VYIYKKYGEKLCKMFSANQLLVRFTC